MTKLMRDLRLVMEFNRCNAAIQFVKDNLFLDDAEYCSCSGILYRGYDLKSVERVLLVIVKSANRAYLFPEIVLALKTEPDNLTKRDIDTYEIKEDNRFRDPIFLLKLTCELAKVCGKFNKSVCIPFYDRPVNAIEYVQKPEDTAWNRLLSLLRFKVA